MSTQALIYVKVRNEDKGKTLECKIDNINLDLRDKISKVRVDEIINKITPITLDKDYISFCVTHDGNVELTGKELYYEYDYGRALNLALLGDEASICNFCVPYCGKIDFKKEWEIVKPIKTDYVDQNKMLTYVLDDDENWYVADGNGKFELVLDKLFEMIKQ